MYDEPVRNKYMDGGGYDSSAAAIEQRKRDAVFWGIWKPRLLFLVKVVMCLGLLGAFAGGWNGQ